MKILYTFLIMVLTLAVYGQNTYNMSAATNGNTITSCGGVTLPLLLYDSGGSTGAYSDNESYTITFCPNAANKQMKAVFTDWQVNSPGDILTVYDGTSTAAPLVGTFDNFQSPVTIQASATNTSGCLTFQWISDGTLTDDGFAIRLTCSDPCQTILAELALATPSPVPLVDGYIDICPGEMVSFFGEGNYPENNIFYNQSDLTSNFVWTIEGQQFTGPNVNYTFSNPGGYRVQLDITDQEGCESYNILNQAVRVAPEAYFSGTSIDQTAICVGDTINAQGFVFPVQADFAIGVSRGDSVELPDIVNGVPVAHSTSLSVSDFLPGQTLNSFTDLPNICLKIEHSYLGDLDIDIVCPNGQTVILHQFPSGNGTYLGFPVEGDDGPGQVIIPGLGTEYCWAGTAMNPTLAVAANDPNYLVAYNAPNAVGGTIAGNTIVGGIYSSVTSMTGLLGCPLNGNWEIVITDNFSVDNGYVFDWGISFPSNLYPALETFTPVDTAKGFLSNSTILSNIGDTVISALPTNPGTAAYVFSTTTDWGCSYDTIMTVEVLPFTNPTCINCDSTYLMQPISDTTICLNDSVDLDATVISNVFESMFTYTSEEPIVTNNQIEARLNVSGVVPGTITSNSIIDVCINISHQFPSDLEIFLIAPSGETLELTTNNGGSSINSNTYENTCFSATAGQLIGLATPPFNGTYLPEGSFNALNGGSINGVWKLQILDAANTSVDGILNDWSITFNQTHTISYFWTPTTGLSCSNCPNPTATPLVSTEYILNINDNFGCAKADTIMVDVVQPLAAPTVSCGDLTATSIQITWAAVTGATAYEVNINNTGWIAANGNLSHQLSGLGQNQTVNFQVRALQGVFCDGNNGIGTTSCTTLTCTQTLNLDSIEIVNCYSTDDGVAYFSTIGSVGTTTYTLSNGITNTTGVFTNLSASSYDVFVIDDNNCVDSLTFVIDSDAVSAQILITDETCFEANNGIGEVIVTGGTAPYTYDWGANANNQTTQTATNLNADTYTVSVSDINNCITSVVGIVNEPDPLELSLTQEDIICLSELGSATAIVTGGTPRYNFTWQTNSGIQNGGNATGLDVGVHTLEVRDSKGCIISDSVVITGPDTPISAIINTEDVDCFGDEDGLIEVIASGGIEPYEYALDAVDYTNSNILIGLDAANYTVSIRDANGCILEENVSINEPDEIIIELGSVIIVEYGETIDLNAQVTNGVQPFIYVWQPADSTLSCLDCPNPTVSEIPFYKRYDLIVTDVNGCTGENFVILRTTKTRNVFVANAFTPNGDGVNDVLFVQGDAQVTSINAFRIYDRWGELVFESIDNVPNNESLGWDGTFKGQDSSPNTYVWYAEVEFADGEVKMYQGDAVLIR